MTSALLLSALLALTGPASATSTGSGTSSTGNVDTWGLPPPPAVPHCTIYVHNPDVSHCIPMEACTADSYSFLVTLTLLDASPGDAVALTIAGDIPGVGPLSIPGTMPAPTLYPSDVATYADPVAQVRVQLGGCNRGTTALVTGLVVDGEVSYTIAY